jgi:N-acetylglucosaminyldiphosphoundecaprenol N-acetyl-beta-D-mannosaminyltransferase
VRWASHALGNPLPERVAGSDLVPQLLALAAKNNHKVFFLGGEPAVAAEAVRRVCAAHPGLTASHYSPPFRPLAEMNHAEIIQRVREAAPQILFVSFGCPKAEKWIAQHLRELGVPVCIGVGATIDFLAGHFRRAPVWMQRSGLEWLYRLGQEPRRLGGRYAFNLRVFGGAILAQWWRQTSGRFSNGTGGPALLAGNASRQRVKAPAQLDSAAIRRDRVFWRELAAGGVDCQLDLSAVRRIDSTGIGLLVQLRKRLQHASRQLLLVNPSPAVRRALQSQQLDDFFSVVTDITPEPNAAATTQENLI